MNLDRRGGREELGDIEEGKTIINAYYVRKKSIYSMIFMHKL